MTAAMQVLGSRSAPGAPSMRLHLRRDAVAYASVGFIALVLVVAALASIIAPYDPDIPRLADRLAEPLTRTSDGRFYLLGTDALGRDLLSRIIHGSRVAMLVGLLSVAISGTMGVGLGLIAGYVGGWVDQLVMRLVDIQLSFPFILLAIAVIGVLGPNLQNIIIVLGVTAWVTYARLVRAEVLALREREFIQAARAVGVGDRRIILRHILPNVTNSAVVIATISIPQMIIAEASLSFLGLGVRPPTASWGSMLADGREHLLSGAWWPTVFPGLAIALVVLAINLIGDWLRDRLDPRLQL